MVVINKLKNKHPDYYEGILQLRDCPDKVIDWVRKTVAKDKRARISKDKKVRGGRDLYFSDQHYLQRIGKKLKETFPGILKKSSKLFTVSRVSGKEVHRVNVMFRSLPVKVGKFFDYLGEEVKIVKVDKMVTLLSKDGRRFVVKLDVFLHNLRSAL
ncbi:hypothetical protein DRJ25_01190 [Candidatus Woesearchaeota archaeon]|nr:MAG: hypothetical protein DRJ25_01190 [Candidatus Woesearchaeota archaeon]